MGGNRYGPAGLGRVPIAQGKCGNFDKTHGILWARVVNYMIQKVHDIATFAVRFSKFSESLSLMK